METATIYKNLIFNGVYPVRIGFLPQHNIEEFFAGLDFARGKTNSCSDSIDFTTAVRHFPSVMGDYKVVNDQEFDLVLDKYNEQAKQETQKIFDEMQRKEDAGEFAYPELD